MTKMKRVIVLLQFMFLVCSVSADPIHDAAENGDVAGISKLLNQGVDVNSVDKAMRTALHHAAYEGHVNAVSLLIDNGADIEVKAGKEWMHRDALHFALIGYLLNIVDVLNIVDLLIKKGADANSMNDYGETALDVAAYMRININGGIDTKQERRINTEIINLLKESGGFWEGIQRAVAGGDLVEVNQFLDEGGWVDTVDTRDRTLLWHAAGAGQFEMVKLLIAKGAHINAKDDFGYTPLDHAKDKKCSEIYSYLRQNGGKLRGEIIPVDPEKIPLQDAAKRLDLVERTLKGIQNLILDGPSGELSIKKLQGLFVISGQAGSRVEVQYHTGDNNWQVREIVTLQSNRQLYIDSSSFDEKRFYRIKKVD